MTPIQQLFLGQGGKKSTYIDEVFSTHLYTGNASDKTITNNINFDEGGLVWIKRRNASSDHALVDTVRGASQYISSNSHIGNVATGANNNFNSFTSTGYTLKDDNGNDYFNKNNTPYSSWSFRRASGFFDVVSWTGNAVNSSSPPRQIAHNLKSVPGAIWVKCLTANQSWACYHKSLGATKYMHLNGDAGAGTSVAWWNNQEPTSTHFTVHYDGQVNEINQQYVAYIFGGGESPNSAATSIDLDGNEGLDIAASSSMNLGTGQFCIEGWFKMDDAPGSGSPAYARLFMLDGPTGNNAPNLQITINPTTYELQVQNGSSAILGTTLYPASHVKGRWVHFALTRYSNTLTLYIDGKKAGTASTSVDFNPNSGSPRVRLGHFDTSSNGVFNGRISNIRITTNDTVYSSEFRPPTEPLTTTSQGVSSSNVKLLCCNGSSTTSSTVTPGTITAIGSPTASTNSPFQDPAAFVFGESGSESIINTGSYVGSSSADYQIDVGFEPQFVIIKRASGAANWAMFDSMRGIVSESHQSNSGEESYLYPNLDATEYDANRISLTPTGFIVDNGGGVLTTNPGENYIWIAIRRPDGYVQKPVEDATKVFAIDVGHGGSTSIPTFDSGFPVDLVWMRQFASTGNNSFSSRLTGGGIVRSNNTDAETSPSSTWSFDWMDGWNNSGADNSWISFMWKRSAGFDCLVYQGDGASARQIPHSLSKIPEMMWVRGRGPDAANWYVYHKDIGNTRVLHLETTDAKSSESQARWDNSTPTSTHFSIGVNPNTNGNSYLALLFSSVENISKVGSYSGSGGVVTITTGFQPRFIIVKKTNGAGGWHVFDTTRGMGSGNDPLLYLNSNGAQITVDYVTPSSTGWSTTSGNLSQGDYIYYAHA